MLASVWLLFPQFLLAIIDLEGFTTRVVLQGLGIAFPGFPEGEA